MLNKLPADWFGGRSPWRPGRRCGCRLRSRCWSGRRCGERRRRWAGCWSRRRGGGRERSSFGAANDHYDHKECNCEGRRNRRSPKFSPGINPDPAPSATPHICDTSRHRIRMADEIYSSYEASARGVQRPGCSGFYLTSFNLSMTGSLGFASPVSRSTFCSWPSFLLERTRL